MAGRLETRTSSTTTGRTWWRATSCEAGSSSITGLAFYPGGSYPARYDGALFFADYSRNCIWVMLKGANGLPDPTKLESFATPAVDPLDPENPVLTGPVDLVTGAERRPLLPQPERRHDPADPVLRHQQAPGGSRHRLSDRR